MTPALCSARNMHIKRWPHRPDVCDGDAAGGECGSVGVHAYQQVVICVAALQLHRISAAAAAAVLAHDRPCTVLCIVQME